jgi:hypothetical protein
MGKNINKTILAGFILIIFGVGIFLRITNLYNVAGRSPDERVYTYQAKVLAMQGPSGLRSLIHEHALTPELWIYPPPIRIGYLYFLSGVMKATDNFTENTGAYISCAFSIISLLLLTVIGLRFFNPWITLYALLFAAVSPIELAIARRAWQDSMIGCAGLGLIYFCSEISRNTGKKIWYILFAIAGVFCILIKESGVAIYGLCLLWILWVIFVVERAYLKGLLVALFGGMSIVIAAAILTHAAGGIVPVVEVIRHWKEAVPTNRYAIEYQTGPWYYFLQGFWIISPSTALLFLAGAFNSFLPQRTKSNPNALPDTIDRRAALGMLLVVTGLVIMAIARPYFQNLRYVSVVFVPFYLIGGFGLWYLLSLIKVLTKERVFYVIVFLTAAVLLAALINDYLMFKRIFIRTGILDTSIRMIREFSH